MKTILTNKHISIETRKRALQCYIEPVLMKRQATFLGHVMKRGKLEHLVTTGKFEGKRSRGRQREKIMDGLATWLGPGKVSDILAAVKDRDLWRDMIANAYKQGTHT
ncbi:UDP-glucuronosyltransferase 2a1-like [Plakobranchus ocellatus]|uniref:UDP-glucuronosyltransferase 2a1-like n=1 Tax=Plakobranchus ocellatus TaxID=259542 RepID=A0AAV4BRH5_9GAST|nr:UDP-glucuronosyltransferase 2a1-like [Plakobranchus ocellatus]